MNQIRTVMKFEFLTFARSGAFIGITIFMVLLALIGPAIPRIIGLFSEMDIGTERRIAVADYTGNFNAETISAYVSPAVTLFPTAQAARAAMTDGGYHYAAALHGDRFTLYVTGMGMGALHMEDDLAWMLREHFRFNAFAEAGVDADTHYAIMAFRPVGEIMTLGATGEIVEDTAENFVSNMIFSYVLSFILYFALLSGGSYLLTAVVREKSTKTMELLITSCKSGRLLNGKVLGVSAAILAQVLLMVGAAALSMNLFVPMDGDGFMSMFNLTFDPYIMGMLVIFFFLGFLMYAYMYAALASTVSRMEDANAVQALPMYLIIIGFFVAIFGMTNPGAAWINVVSHIPFFAPFVMFMRICLGTASHWDVFISIGAQALTVVLVAYLGGRIYRMGTLMYGNKPRLKDILAAFR